MSTVKQGVNEFEAAKRLGVSPQLLRKFRSGVLENGPPFFRVGKAVRYDTERLEQWIRAQEEQTSAAA